MRGMQLPTIGAPRELAIVRRDVSLFSSALEHVRRAHRLHGDFVPFAGGSAPVFAIGAHAVVKLYPPMWPEDVVVERAFLRRLWRRLPIATPEMLGEGELDGWRYLVMRRIRGVPLEVLLAHATARERMRALARLGETIAALHRVPTFAMPSPVPDFDRFLAGRVRGIGEIAARARAPWAAALPAFVRATPRGPTRRVLLHTELGPGHVLAQTSGERIELRGMIDFVDSMVGDAEYDLAVVAFFITRGQSRELAAFLDGYGVPRDARGMDLARRLLRYLVLHRFGALPWLARIRPLPSTVTTADELAASWIGAA